MRLMILQWILYLFVIVHAILNPEEFPNLLAGSFTDGNRLSTGNTLPLVGQPWGFNHWSPQTRDASRYTGSWWFSGSEHTFTWMRCTHQPSPWIGDWGYFLFVPQVGEVTRAPQYLWQPRGAYIKPFLFDATLAPINLRIELTPTDHAAYLRVTFPATTEWGEKHICFAQLHFEDHGTVGIGGIGGHFLYGVSTAVHSDRMLVSNLRLHVRAESSDATGVHSHDDLMCFQYKNDATVVHVRLATSLISQSQAITNLQREIPSSCSFDQTLYQSKIVWNRLMRRVNVLDAGELSERASRHLTIFYTGLYRALTFPRRIDEIDSNGNTVHYSPYDVHGRTFPGPLVTDNGFWDTYRTVYPLLSLIYPDQLGIIVQGWLNAYKEGGWLPSWASPGYRNCMVGTFADVVVADAIVKDVPGFDLRTAIDALSKDAFESAPGYAGGAVGKEGLGEYMGMGYLPRELGGEIVSRALDYGFSDYSTALAFLYLSQKIREKFPSETDVDHLKEELMSKAKTLYRRAVRAFQSSFDSRRGFMVPKSRNGEFSQRFSPIEWGNGYTEGNAWHHSFPAYSVMCTFLDINNPFIAQLKAKNPELNDLLNCQNGIISLYNNRDEVLKKLYQLLHVQSRFQVGSYGQEIHEMTESVTLAIGQYAHNNQPVHHIPYLFAILGDHRTTQRLTREVLNRGYGMDFYAGDEDNGEQGAWFVLSALGLYSVAPGSSDYVISSPLFRHVRIAHPKAFSLNKVSEEDEKPGQYLDLFAFSRPSVSDSEKLWQEDSNFIIDKVTVDHTVTIDGKQHYLISDTALQKNSIIQFHYEAKDSLSNTNLLLYDSLTQQLHSQLSKHLDQHQHLDFVDGQSPSTSADTVSSLKKKLHQQADEIQKLQTLLSHEGAKSDNLQPLSVEIAASSPSIAIFYILCIGFLVALMMAKLLEYGGCLDVGGDSAGVGGGNSFNYCYFCVIGIARRAFLVLRSYYFRYFGGVVTSNDPDYSSSSSSSSWSLKSRAHNV